jgi:hypothetical protein
MPISLVAGSYALIWVSFAAGFWFVRRRSEQSKALEVRLWNARIDKMQFPSALGSFPPALLR